MKRGHVRVDGTETPTFRPDPKGEGHKRVLDEWYQLYEFQYQLRV